MKLTKSLTKALILSIIFSGCAPKVKEGYDEKTGYVGNISISGAFALYPIVVLWGEDFKKLNPNVRFNISAGGAGKGIADVLTNMTDIGLVSRDLHPQELEKGAYPIFVAKDAVLGTFNSNHPDANLIKERGLTQNELEDVFVHSKYKSWNQIDSRFSSAAIGVYVRSDAAGAAETWAKYFKKSQEDLKGVGIFGDPGLAQAIKDSPTAIGFNNINYVYDLKTKKTTPNIEVIPIDINKNGKIDSEESFYDNIDVLTEAVALGKYPSPPSRELLFVIKNDNNSKLIKEFIRFVLDKNQQGYLLENGYVPLTVEQRNKELEKLTN
ncbi:MULTISPECIES: PstS family phosphate ABC transporter substrate-binding protein [Sphingobacterium]|uniref:PstS family phosphate ABC transporter substrate-binding protein n=1 Tax=Sphingobacterium litopenaei TaxID=2763500 RepID=A0ABR7YFC3_9SPHI|nr:MULTISPECIES: PstS family phosphate ABC transporter substrate-binding protein [Sphingobacterium]MBD1429981.1 PstS family phosphate ABC transporter substrate-binding protein [Sphingobacterium litopenaei]NGM72308.1 PstS family phosphate ABC transporter substrate-binding protein [Sphingobacterium sp. SGL-16]